MVTATGRVHDTAQHAMAWLWACALAAEQDRPEPDGLGDDGETR